MQSSDRVLAGRYAAALFQAAAEKAEDQKVQAELGVARERLLSRDALLRHPRVPIADKKNLASAELDGKVGTTTARFISLLIEKKRYELFPMIAAMYARLAAEKRGVIKAVVRCARPLSADTQKTLAARLKVFAGKDVEIEVKEDPELIGGIAVKIGDWALDSSLRGQLRRMRESIQ
ncbi:MAG: ATP synthase F1 subunit delta [Elusimicrobia bacterium]|nr:ATP synthase F1 subunit delta [Elusimicrobiota bacterium]